MGVNSSGIEGAGGITKNGNATLYLASGNGYSGDTTVNAGTLSVGSVSGNIGTGSLSLTGGTLAYTGASDTTGRTIYVGSGTTNGVNVAAGGTLECTGIVRSTEGANAQLDKYGTGTLILSNTADNSYLFVAAHEGTVKFNSASAQFVHAASIAAIDAGAVVQLTGTGDYQVWASDDLGGVGGTIAITGGTLDLNGRNQRQTAFSVSAAGGTLANTAAGTTSTYTPHSADFYGNLTVNTVGDIEIANGTNGGNFNAHEYAGGISKIGAGVLTLSNTIDSWYLTVAAHEGTVKLNSTSAQYVHAASITAIDSAAVVQLTGTGEYQVWASDDLAGAGGPVALTGGTFDLNGRNQRQTAFSVSAAGGTLANTAAGTTSTYTPYSGLLSGTLTVDAVGDIRLGIGANGSGLAGSSGITKTGDGLLSLLGDHFYTGLTTVQAGTLQMSEGSYVNVFTNGGADIQGGKGVLDYTAGGVSPAPEVLAGLTASYNNGAWDVGQIRNTTASATGLTLGWADDTTLQQVTIMATYAGDANLSGKVDVADLTLLLNNYNKADKSWADGDFNYDGNVNVGDLTALLNKYNQSIGGSVAAGAGLSMGSSAVPEPGMLALSATALIGLLVYAWRGRKQS
jgi:fibronectin-binding autotransporter adhesin